MGSALLWLAIVHNCCRVQGAMKEEGRDHCRYREGHEPRPAFSICARAPNGVLFSKEGSPGLAVMSYCLYFGNCNNR